MKVAILAAIIAGAVTSAQAFTTLCRAILMGCSASSNARMAPTSSSARAGREVFTAPPMRDLSTILRSPRGRFTNSGTEAEAATRPKRNCATPRRRKEAVVQLKVKGLSTRQIAAAVGASQSQVVRDLAEPNGSESEPNGSPQIEVSKGDILASMARRAHYAWANVRALPIARKVKFLYLRGCGARGTVKNLGV